MRAEVSRTGFSISCDIESTLQIPLLSICMGLILVAIPIVYFHQTIDLVSGYHSHKGSEKVYFSNPDNSNIVRRGLGGSLGVIYLHLLLAHGYDAHSSPDEVVFILRLIYHCRRPNLAQEPAQS